RGPHDVDLAEHQALAGPDDAGRHQGVLPGQRFEEAGALLDRGHGLAVAQARDDGQHHGGVGGRHQRLPADHAPDAGQPLRERQAHRGFPISEGLDLQAQVLDPGREPVGQQLLQAIG
ncbi:hypothetical protein RZS08_41225, partial [Arthrospira platensis SPKY1]|nr:hypothetical protein [Arthrospira platensis SPKY1]